MSDWSRRYAIDPWSELFRTEKRVLHVVLITIIYNLFLIQEYRNIVIVFIYILSVHVNFRLKYVKADYIGS